LTKVFPTTYHLSGFEDPATVMGTPDGYSSAMVWHRQTEKQYIALVVYLNHLSRAYHTNANAVTV
jgi:hypothetical protein